MPPNHRRRGALGCLAAATSILLALGTPASADINPGGINENGQYVATPTPQNSDALSPTMKKAEGDVLVFVKFKGQGAYEQTQPDEVLHNKQEPVKKQGEATSIKDQVENQARQAAQDSGAEIRYTVHNTMRGAALHGDAKKIRSLAARDDVERITPIVAKKSMNAYSDIDSKAVQAWAESTGYTGKGVKIAVVDSGIDYTHTDFGGPGTKEAYEKAKTLTDLPDADSGLIDRSKVVGGIDLVGDDYNALDAGSTPKPDNNPLDCRPEGYGTGGHGTHVAGTAAGYGVNADGSTFRGDYSKLNENDLKNMKIGPGSAPEAQLLSIRVFGCQGSSNVVMQGLDRALDPNEDGDFSDRANIINLSLGSEFSPADDPDSAMVDSLAQQGILTVTAAGNANEFNGVGDTYSDSGSPANAASSISVANANGTMSVSDQLKIVSPENGIPLDFIDGIFRDFKFIDGDYSLNFPLDKAPADKLTGYVTLAPERNHDGCKPFTPEEAEKIKGKWVMLDWEVDYTYKVNCSSAERFDHVAQAGGTGVLLVLKDYPAQQGFGGNATIPGFRINTAFAADIKPYVEAGTFKVEANEAYKKATHIPTRLEFGLNSMSSRGQHGTEGFIKPDVAAPGVDIFSASVGQGIEGVYNTGTSMAAPHVSGIAAQVMQAHPDYTPAMVKAAIMNSADTNITNNSGYKYAVDRMGSGFVNAKKAVNAKVLVYDEENPERVSLSFGVLEYPLDGEDHNVTRNIVVRNMDSVAHTYELSYQYGPEIPGSSPWVPPLVTVEPGETVKVPITFSTYTPFLEKTIDPTLEKEQTAMAYVNGQYQPIISGKRQYIASVSGRILLRDANQDDWEELIRLPVHAAPKPISTMKVQGSEIQFENGKATETTVKLAGQDVDQGGYRSMMGAFELGAASPRIPTENLDLPSSQSMDLQYVGAASDAPALKAAGQNPNDGKIYFGISTWGIWDSMHPGRQLQVTLDTNRDGKPDYNLEVGPEKGLDYPLVKVWKANGDTWEITNRYPLNGAWGDTDTNIMDTNVMVLGVPLKDLGLTADTASSIDYAVSTNTWSNAKAGGDYVDATEKISFNPFAPKVWFEGESAGVPGLFADRNGGEVKVHRVEGEKPSALFLHLHNGTGDLSGQNGAAGERAQVVPLSEQQQSNLPSPSEPTESPKDSSLPGPSEPTKSPKDSSLPGPSEPTESPKTDTSLPK